MEEPRDVRFEFGFDAQPVKEALSVKNLSVSVGGKKLFENVDLTLFRGEKLAIVGANGVGKTSFIKALTGEIPFSGRVNWGAGVKTGLFRAGVQKSCFVQHRLRRGLQTFFPAYAL